MKVFLARPWVVEVWETKQNSKEDVAGYDMFVRTRNSFLKAMMLGGAQKILPIQIKSSERRIKSFIRKHSGQKRFFNLAEKDHQFVLCGMDDEDLVLADIVGQIMVHVAGNDISEREVVNWLRGNGDNEAVLAYKRNKDLLIFNWYGSHLPPL